MAKFVKEHSITFATSATSPEIVFDSRDVIVAIKTSAAYVGNTLAASFSFDDGSTWEPVYNEAGTQLCLISDATLADGAAYSMSDDQWDVTNRVKFVSSSTSEVGVVTIITKSRN